MSENEVMRPASFEDRLKERIRESIGELMSDDDLKKIVERGVEECLFKPRLVSRDSWGRSEEKPAIVQEQIEKHLQVEMQRAVDNWIFSNAEKIEAVMEDVVKAGAGNALIHALNDRFQSSMMDFHNSVRQQMVVS